MTVAVVCITALCTIVGYDSDPALHGLSTRIFVMEQAIEENLARALFHDKLVRMLFDMEVSKLLDKRLIYAVNSRLDVLKRTVEVAKTTYRDADYCYEKAFHEMKHITMIDFNKTALPCVNTHINWLQDDLRQMRALVANLEDGKRQLRNVRSECQHNTTIPLTKCMENMITQIENNMKRINKITQILTREKLHSYTNSYDALDKCLASTDTELFTQVNEIAKKGQECARSTRHPLCPTVEP